MEKSPKIPEEFSIYERGSIISPERRDTIKSQTQKKIIAAVFAGAFAAGIFYQKSGERAPRPEVNQAAISAPEVTPITEAEQEKQKELENLIDELEKDVDTLSELMLQITTLRKHDKFLPHYLTKRPAQEKSPAPKISDMEKAGIDSKVFAELIAKTFPASWQKHLKSVKLASENQKVPKERYGNELANIPTCAHADYDPRAKQTDIVFFPVCQDKNNILELTSHELGHAIDWDANKILSPEEKMQFLKKVLTRVNANDRFISQYVEKIEHNISQVKNYVKAGEYWAEIIKEYMDNPPQVLKENGKPNNLADGDIKLIEWFLKKTDPDFDAKFAWLDRAELTSWTFDPNIETLTPPKILAKNGDNGDPVTATSRTGKKQ